MDLKYHNFVAKYPTTRLANIDYFRICKSGINSFNGKKIYLDTSSVMQTSITDESYLITYEDRPSRANMQPHANTVWFAKLKDSPKYILVKKSDGDLLNGCIFSTGFMGLQCEEHIVNYLYCMILSKDFNDQKNLLSNGATMQAINNDSFAEIQIPAVKKSAASDFGKEINECVNLISYIRQKTHRLKEIKSLLLQKYFG